MTGGTTGRKYSAGYFTMQIDGKGDSIPLVNVDGGWAKTNAIDVPSGDSSQRIRHISTVDIEPFTIECTLQPSLAAWMKGTADHTHARRNIVITHAAADLEITFQHEALGCLITEIVVPALDNKSKSPTIFKIKIQPERVTTKSVSAGNRTNAPVYVPVAVRAKPPTHMDYRLSIDGTTALIHTSKIDSMVWKQGIKRLYTGADRFPQIEPTASATPNIHLEIPTRFASDLRDWSEKRPEKPVSSDLRGGTIELLSQGRTAILGSIELSGLDLRELKVRNEMTLVELSCEQLTFSVPTQL